MQKELDVDLTQECALTLYDIEILLQQQAKSYDAAWAQTHQQLLTANQDNLRLAGQVASLEAALLVAKNQLYDIEVTNSRLRSELSKLEYSEAIFF